MEVEAQSSQGCRQYNEHLCESPKSKCRKLFHSYSIICSFPIIIIIIITMLIDTRGTLPFVSACIKLESGNEIGNIAIEKKVSVGDRLTIKCELNETNVQEFIKTNQHVQKIDATMFELTETKLNHYKVSPPQGSPYQGSIFKKTILNPLSVTFTKKNISLADSGIYGCVLKDPKTNRIITTKNNDARSSCLITVSVLQYELNCDFHMYSDLRCTWNNKNPDKDHQVNYTLQYQENFLNPDGSVNFSLHSCPKDPESTPICIWTSETVPKVPEWNQCLQNGEVTLLLTTISGDENLSFNFTKPCSAFSRLLKPTGIHVIDNHGTSATIVWDEPYDYSDPGMRSLNITHSILLFYQDESNGTEWSRKLDNTINSYTLIDLIPNKNYTIGIKLLSENPALGDSEAVTYTFKTNATKPVRSPFIEQSSFEVELKGEDAYRSVTLYWQHIEPIHHYGNQFEYHVKSSQSYFDGNYTLSKVNLWKTSEYCMGDEPCAMVRLNGLLRNQYYLFSIYASNECGEADVASFIKVPAQDKILPKPKKLFVVMQNLGQYRLHWIDVDREPTTGTSNHTLFWCSGKNVDSGCRSMDGSLNVSHIEKYYDLPLYVFGETLHRFAISYYEDGRSSGLQWASCMVQKSSAIQLSATSTVHNATSIYISWNFNCASQQALIVKYTLKICPDFISSTDSGNCSNPRPKLRCRERKYLPGEVLDNVIFVTDMKPYTLNNITLTAFNEEATGETALLKVAMPTYHPSDRPRELSVTSVTSDSTKLTWKPPIETNGPNYYYRVIYNNFTSQKVPKTPDCSQVYQLSNLESYTNYTIMIDSCIDIDGSSSIPSCSPRSNELIVQTKPSKPSKMDAPEYRHVNESLVEKPEINVTWTPPKHPNGIITGYRLYIEANSVELLNFTVNPNENYKLISVDCSMLTKVIDAVKLNESDHINLKMLGLSVSAMTQDFMGDKSVPTPLLTFCNDDSSTVIIYSMVAMVFIVLAMIISSKIIFKHAGLRRKYLGVQPNVPPQLFGNTQCGSDNGQSDDDFILSKGTQHERILANSKRYIIGHDDEDSLESRVHLRSYEDEDHHLSLTMNHYVRRDSQSNLCLSQLDHVSQSKNKSADYLPHDMKLDQFMGGSGNTSSQSIIDDYDTYGAGSILSNGSLLANILKDPPPPTTSINNVAHDNGTNDKLSIRTSCF